MARATGLGVCGYLPVFLLGVQSPLMGSSLQLGPQRLGLCVGAFYLAAALFTWGGGNVMARLGHRLGWSVALMVVGSGCLGTSAVTDSVQLIPCMLWLGVGNALCQAQSNRSLAESVSPARRALAFGLKQAAVPLAVLMASAATNVTQGWLSWRGAFAAVSAVAVAAMFLARRPDERLSQQSSSRGGHRGSAGLVLLASTNTLASAVVNAMAAFLPAWLVRHGFSVSQCTAVLVVASLLNVAFRVVASNVGGRRGEHIFRLVALQLLLGAVAVAAFTVSGPWALSVAVLASYAIGWSWPGLLLYGAARAHPEAAARASTMVQAGGFAGGALGPPLFGWYVALHGFPSAWLAGAILLVVSACVLLLAERAMGGRDQ